MGLLFLLLLLWALVGIVTHLTTMITLDIGVVLSISILTGDVLCLLLVEGHILIGIVLVGLVVLVAIVVVPVPVVISMVVVVGIHSVPVCNNSFSALCQKLTWQNRDRSSKNSVGCRIVSSRLKK